MLKLNCLEMALSQALEERDLPWVARSDRPWVSDVKGDILVGFQTFKLFCQSNKNTNNFYLFSIPRYKIRCAYP
ncbi:MAG: hypothetical protein AB4426_09875, partial [Xenococcaceae cyanobacterium]